MHHDASLYVCASFLTFFRIPCSTPDHTPKPQWQTSNPTTCARALAPPCAAARQFRCTTHSRWTVSKARMARMSSIAPVTVVSRSSKLHKHSRSRCAFGNNWHVICAGSGARLEKWSKVGIWVLVVRIPWKWEEDAGWSFRLIWVMGHQVLVMSFRLMLRFTLILNYLLWISHILSWHVYFVRWSEWIVLHIFSSCVGSCVEAFWRTVRNWQLWCMWIRVGFLDIDQVNQMKSSLSTVNMLMLLPI